MGRDQIAVKRYADVEHVLVECGETLAQWLRTDRKDRKSVEFQILLLLEKQRQAKADPERGQHAELFKAKAAGLDQNDFPRSRHHEIVEADRAGQQQGLAAAGRTDAQVRDRLVRLRPDRTESVGPLNSQPNFAPHSVGRSLPNRDEAWHQPAA
jgi:hypothetical protein